MMENDLSARAFDTIARKSGQFGFFQKRIFFINALIQSVCLSILLYTNVCVPELDLTNMADGPLPLPAKNGTGQLFNNNTNGTFTNHNSTIDNSTTTNNNHTTNNNTTINFQLPTAFNLSTLPNQHSHNAPSSTQPLTYSSLLQETTEPDPNANNNNIINNNDDNTRDDNNGVFVDLSTYMPTTITNHVDTPNKNKNRNNNYNNDDNSNKNNDDNNDNNNDDILHRHKRRDTIHTDHLSSNVVDQDQLTTESLERLDQDIGGQFREQNGAVGIPSITAQREHGVDDSRASPQEVRKDAKLQTISNRSNYNDLVDKHDNNSNNDDDDDDVDGVDFNDDNVSDKLLNANDYDSLHGNVDTPPVSSVKNKNNNDYNYSNINDGDDDDDNNNNNNNNHIKNENSNSDNDDYKNKYHNIKNNNNNNDINDSTYYKNRKDINNKNEDNDDNEVSTLSVETKSHEHNKPDDVTVTVYAHHSPHRNIPPANTKDTTTTTTTTTHFGRPHFRRPHPDPNHVTLSQEETPQTLPHDRNGNGNGDDDETPKSRKGRGNPVARLKENMASVTVETTSTEQQPFQYGDFPTKRTNGVNTTSTERQPSRYGDFPSNRTSVVNENTTIEEDSDGPVHPLMDLRITRDQLLSSFDLEDLLQLAFTLQGVGVVLGSLMGGLMADVFGRRRPLFLSLLGMAVTQCALALSVSWTLFLVLRTFAVGFAGATLVVSFVMVIEFVGPSWRDACTCSCLWTLGAVSLSLETMVTTNWRWLALFSGGLALPLLGTFYTTPESLRWLQCHHKFPAAEGVYREVVSVNSAAVPEIMSLLDQARVCIVNNMHRKRYTFLDLFYNLTSVRSTFALVYTGMVSSCVYACLSSIVRQLTGNPYVDGFLPFLIDMPLTWSTIIVNRCLGRRWCLFLYSVASGLALMSVTILHMTGNVSSMPSLITGIALFGKIGVTASILLIFLVAIEMYPTVSRGMGVGVALASGSGGIILSQVLLFLRDYHYIVPFVVYGLMMSTVGLVGLLLPETLNLPLTNVQQCRHRKIPLVEGGRQAGGPPFP